MTASAHEKGRPESGGTGRLERFRLAKAPELEALRARARAGGRPAVWQGHRPSFAAALLAGTGRGPLSVIAEYKRASPSRGRICETVSVEQAALAYARGGAAALSILTEEKYFDGELAFLGRARRALDQEGFQGVPLLRKDFLTDPLQIEATAETPASAFLLIVRQTPDAAELRSLRELGESFGMEAVVEIFDEEDLELARAGGARIIQVNARDLETLQVDRGACLTLLAGTGVRKDEVWIAASGMEGPEHLREAARTGFAAALVGTALMRHGTPAEDLAALLATASDS